MNVKEKQLIFELTTSSSEETVNDHDDNKEFENESYDSDSNNTGSDSDFNSDDSSESSSDSDVIDYNAAASEIDEIVEHCEISSKQYKNTRNLTTCSKVSSVLNNLDPSKPFYELHRHLLQAVETTRLYHNFLESQTQLKIHKLRFFLSVIFYLKWLMDSIKRHLEQVLCTQ